MNDNRPVEVKLIHRKDTNTYNNKQQSQPEFN